MKVLKTAIENQRWDIAAHALVVGMVQAKQKEDKSVKKRRSTRKPKIS